jgi:hypothetical protein
MKGLWQDSTRMIFGGYGHSLTGGYGPECDFMYPGGSDTLNWGVGSGCQLPNGPADWTEETAGSSPGDRRGIGAMGPFTFKPGDMQEIDFAYIFARDYKGVDSTRSVSLLRQRIDVIREAFLTNTLPNGGSFNGIGKKQDQNCFFSVYPNPAVNQVTLTFHSIPVPEGVLIRLINSQGQLIKTIDIHKDQVQFNMDIPGLSPGLYVVNFFYSGRSFSERLIITK